MESLFRLIPFFARQRLALITAVLLSFGVACFSVAQLWLVFPSMQLLLEEKNWHEHLRNEIALSNAEARSAERQIESIDGRLNDSQWRSETSEPDIAALKKELRKAESNLRKAEHRVAFYEQTYSLLSPILPTDRFNFLAFLLGFLLVLTLFKEICSYLQETIVGGVVQRVVQTMRQRLFRSTLKLDHQTLLLETTPALMSRFTYDLAQVAYGLNLLCNKIVVEPLKIAICVGYAFFANWRLTLLAFVCAPLLAVLFGNLGRKLKRAAQRQMESMSRVYRVLEETLNSMRTVQAYRNERLHRGRLAREHRDYYEKAMRILRIDAVVSPAVEFLAMCAVFVASLPGAYLVLRGETSILGIQLADEPMTVADLCLLYTCMAGVLDPGRKLSGVYSKLKKTATACGRVFAWMDRASLVKKSTSTVPLPRHSKSIEFDRVIFHYAKNDSEELGIQALSEVSVAIPFRSTVAVVGGNGCGKSTLVNLLPRFFDPHEGHVRIDGVDLSTIDPSDLRSQIGIVTQETLLFDWSISENIRYGKPDATEAEIQSAAEKAFVTDFVGQLPDGFATQVGEKGHRLSGGQRQRVALARAILRDPAILILDEATSAIDSQSEQCIHQSLRSLSDNRTTLIVTHSMPPSLLNCITHVLVMDQGKVISFGPHDAVLKTCPQYQRLFEVQTFKRAG